MPNEITPWNKSRRPPGPSDVLCDKYELKELVSRAGVGDLFVAKQKPIDRNVFVKVLAYHYAQEEEYRQRILREAKAAAKIDSEHVATVIDSASTEAGVPFIVMEHLEGESLAQTLEREGPMSLARIKHIGVQLCRALEAAHKKGIAHRDMKPEVVYRVTRGENQDFIKVLDFGLAKVMRDGATENRLTPDGKVFGSPTYMSPEQCRGDFLDDRTDIYSLGVLLYELLTGRPPFVAKTSIALLSAHAYQTPPAPAKVAPGVQVPRELEALLTKALAKSPEDRFRTARELGDALAAVPTTFDDEENEKSLVAAKSQVSDRRRWTLVIAALSLQLVLVVVLVVVLVMLGGRPG